MKTNTAPRNVTLSTLESAEFKVSNNAKIFKILIDGLYTNKIQSITREIWSNALDSHVAAGCPDRPFDIHLPSPFDPAFRVRDYGTGLDHPSVMNLYTELGYSTKEETNDAIGKFGIGSKAPFAYCDNFTVTVWLDGEKRYYSAMIGSDGVPAINLMASESTDAENGLEVSFPVHSKDVSAFVDAAERVSLGFEVKPVVANDPEFAGWPDFPVLMEGDGWRFLKHNLKGFRSQGYARMGPVLYPIDSNALPTLTSDETAVLNGNLVLDFEIGDLEVTASREDLSYGRREPTADAICARVKKIIGEFQAETEAKIAEQPSYFLACCVYNSIVNDYSLPAFIRRVARGCRWRGRDLKDEIVHGNSVDALSITALRHKLVNKAYRFEHKYRAVLEPMENTVVFVEDVREPVKQIAKRLKLFHTQAEDEIEQLVWVRGDGRASSDLLHLMEEMEGIRFITHHDLPEVSKPTYSRSSYSYDRKPVQARILSQYGSPFSVQRSMDEKAFAKGGLYIPLERMHPADWKAKDTPQGLYRAMVQAHLVHQPVYGIPKTLWKQVESPQWTNFYDYAEKVLKGVGTALASGEEALAAMKAADTRIIRVAAEVAEGADFEGTFGKALLHAQTLQREAKALRRKADADAALRRAFAGVGMTPPANKQTRDWEEESEKVEDWIENDYPLFAHLLEVSFSSAKFDLDILREYVINSDIVTSQKLAQAA